jgi:predicted transcriptional regulator
MAREQKPAADAAGDTIGIDPIIAAFTDEVVQKVIELAEVSAGKYTTNHILEQAALAVSLAAGRMNKPKKVSAWDIALREAKQDMTPEELAPVAGAGYKGRPELKGALMKDASTIYADPDLRRRFQELANKEKTN